MLQLDMITLTDYLTQYPQFTFDFSRPLNWQPRIYKTAELAEFPKELAVDIPVEKKGGNGRAKRAQCKTHARCTECGRLLRNDFFATPPSFLSRNGIFSYCRECHAKRNARRYDTHRQDISDRRDVVWLYIAPRCVICDTEYHPASMDMHHLSDKEAHINTLVTTLTFSPNIRNAEALLRECAKCVPLCANCHRALHANAVCLLSHAHAPKYSLVDLMYAISEPCITSTQFRR